MFDSGHVFFMSFVFIFAYWCPTQFHVMQDLLFKWEQLEDTKGVIRSRNSKKDIQHTGQAKNHDRKNNNP
jgi:hypothetical protein